MPLRPRRSPSCPMRWWRPPRRGVPLAGMKLDYDLTILETQARDSSGRVPSSRDGAVRCSTPASSTATSIPTARAGVRLTDLCVHYGIEIGNAHDAAADAMASIEVLFALAVRHDALWGC